MHKKGPYILLGVLLLILIFILGVRYGQNVEKTNKTISYVLSLTPKLTPTLQPSPTPISYATSSSKIWRIKYIYPSNLKVKEDASKSAVLFTP